MKSITLITILCFSAFITFAAPLNNSNKKQVKVQNKIEPKIISHAIVNFSEMAKREAINKKNKTNLPIKYKSIPIGKINKKFKVPDEYIKKIQKKEKNEKKSQNPSTQISSDSSNLESNDSNEIKPGINPIPLGPISSQNDFIALPMNTVDGYLYTPPDTSGVAGNNYLMTTLNTEVRIKDKSGNDISTVSLSNFWAAVVGTGSDSNAGAFDPKIIYDQEENRFICVTLDERDANSGIMLAVSQTDDPTGNWFQWKIDADSDNDEWADFPSPGFNTNWIAISVNMFTISGNNFSDARIWVIDKQEAYNNNLTGSILSFGASSGFTIAPCITFGNQTNIYTIDTGWSSGGDDYVRIGAINGPVNSPTWTHIGYSRVPNSVAPDDAPQIGGSDLIDNGDGRISSPPTYRFGHIFFAFTGQFSSPTRNAIIWGEINAANNAIIQTGIIQEVSTPMYYAYPSIAVNSRTSIVVGFSGFSTGIYASAYYAGREFTNAPNVMQDVKLLKAGEDYYALNFGSGDIRWGDYSATCVDPANDITFWTIQEYAYPQWDATYDRWSTWWGEIYFIPEPSSLALITTLLLFLYRKKQL